MHYSIPDQTQISYHIYDEKAMYPLWGLQRGSQFISAYGKSIIVISPGERNRFSGSDYKNASISIEGKIYMGDVELHVSNQDLHDKNPAYNVVILHVVSQWSLSNLRKENQTWHVNARL